MLVFGAAGRFLNLAHFEFIHQLPSLLGMLHAFKMERGVLACDFPKHILASRMAVLELKALLNRIDSNFCDIVDDAVYDEPQVIWLMVLDHLMLLEYLLVHK